MKIKKTIQVSPKMLITAMNEYNPELGIPTDAITELMNPGDPCGVSYTSENGDYILIEWEEEA